MAENIINNNALAALTRHAAPQVLQAIKQASSRTGVNFAYLVQQAAAESSFDAKAKSGSSSATGLYQFIESTWMNMVKKYGAKHGMGDLAAQIGANGKVADKAVRKQILDLRKDPEKAAVLAAEFASQNKRYLASHVGGKIGATELYLAHFMGAGGAAGFLNAMKDTPLETAADLFPKEARANRNVFYDAKTGEPRTLAGVYDFFAKKFGASPAPETGESSVPVPPRSPRIAANQADFLAARMAMNPFGQDFSGNSGGWGGLRHSYSSLVLDPTELMVMAQMKVPTDPPPAQHAYSRYSYND